MDVIVWACPTPGCGNYYASSSQAHVDLTQEAVMGRVEDRTPTFVQDDGSMLGGERLARGTRADCPDCRARGKRVERISVRFAIALPEPAAA